MSPQTQRLAMVHTDVRYAAPPGSPRHWARSWTYPLAPSSVPRCRRSVVTALRGRGLPVDALDSAALLVTELAGNAVEHAAGHDGVRCTEFTVILTQRGRRLRIEVRDGGRPLPQQRRGHVPDLTSTAGRGLFLVEALSFRWGVRPTALGKSVWCELAC